MLSTVANSNSLPLVLPSLPFILVYQAALSEPQCGWEYHGHLLEVPSAALTMTPSLCLQPDAMVMIPVEGPVGAGQLPDPRPYAATVAARGCVSPPPRQLIPLPAWVLRPPEEDEDGAESGYSWSKSPKHDTGEEFSSAGQAPLACFQAAEMACEGQALCSSRSSLMAVALCHLWLGLHCCLWAARYSQHLLSVPTLRSCIRCLVCLLAGVPAAGPSGQPPLLQPANHQLLLDQSLAAQPQLALPKMNPLPPPRLGLPPQLPPPLVQPAQQPRAPAAAHVPLPHAARAQPAAPPAAPPIQRLEPEAGALLSAAPALTPATSESQMLRQCIKPCGCFRICFA